MPKPFFRFEQQLFMLLVVPDFDFLSLIMWIYTKNRRARDQFLKSKDTAVVAVSKSKIFTPLYKSPFTHDSFSKPFHDILLSNNATLFKLYKFFKTANIIFNGTSSKATYLNMYSNRVALVNRKLVYAMPFASRSYKAYIKYVPKTGQTQYESAVKAIYYKRAFRGFSLLLAKPHPLLFKKYFINKNRLGFVRNPKKAFSFFRCMTDTLAGYSYMFNFIEHRYSNNINKFIQNIKTSISSNLFLPDTNYAFSYRRGRRLSVRRFVHYYRKLLRIKKRYKRTWKNGKIIDVTFKATKRMLNYKENKLKYIKKFGKANCNQSLYKEFIIFMENFENQLERISMPYLQSELRSAHIRMHSGIPFESNLYTYRLPARNSLFLSKSKHLSYRNKKRKLRKYEQLSKEFKKTKYKNLKPQNRIKKNASTRSF
jgi:hypothetical protein